MFKKKTIEDNISDFKKKHGELYSYIKYIDDTKKCFDKITIVCPKHGDFAQNISNHKNGQGCPKCRLVKTGNSHKYSIEQNLNNFKKVHGNLYDYSKYIDKNKYSTDKIIINCQIHGDFEQTIAGHTNGRGCSKCGKIKLGLQIRSSIEENKLNFIKQHENKYDYSKYDSWISNENKITIICPTHGEFKQVLNNHLQGKGCPKCGKSKSKQHKQNNPTGWTLTNWINSANKSKHFDSFKVYIIECWNENEKFYKIGRTYNKIIKRFGDKKQFTYNYKIIKEYVGNAEYIYKLESILKKYNKEHTYLPQNTFKGMYECFSQIK